MKIEKRKIFVLVFILASLVLIIISMKGCGDTIEFGDVIPPTNQFTQRIETSINGISQLAESIADCEVYERILNDIRYFHGNGDLGNTSYDNDYWRDNLTEKLLIEYSKKTIRWALWTFSKSNCIGAEIDYLSCCITNITKNQNGIESPYIDSIAEFNESLALYKEIQTQNSKCASSLFAGQITTKAEYPDTQTNISKNEKLIETASLNKYLKNCDELPIQLNNSIKQSIQFQYEFINNLIDYYEKNLKTMNAGTKKDSVEHIEKQYEQFKNLISNNYDFTDKIEDLGDRIQFLP